MALKDKEARRAYAKAWRERRRAADPDYVNRMSRESHARMSDGALKQRAAKQKARNDAWRERDPEGYRAYHKQKAHEFYLKRKSPDYQRVRQISSAGMVWAEYLLARRLSKHGLTLEEYRSMRSVVPGCALCGELPQDEFSLCIDHDHSTGRVRGLLCRSCNTGLGKLGDNIAGLKNAIEYLGGQA